MRLFKNLFPSLLDITHVINPALTASSREQITFKTGLKYTPEKFKLVVRERSESRSISLDPFCKALTDSIANEKSETREFSRFLVKDLNHQLIEFDPKKSFMWAKFFNVAFNEFSFKNFEGAVSILKNTIIPAYPVLEGEDACVDFIVELMENEESFEMSSALSAQVVQVFYYKLDFLLGAPNGKIEEFTQLYRKLLWDARRSAKITNETFRYNYAFLLNVPMEDLKVVSLPDYEKFSHFQEYLNEFARSTYEQLMEHSPENVRIAIGKVLPNVYDQLPTDSSYEEIIKAYVAQDSSAINEDSFVNRVMYMMKSRGKNGFEHLSIYQRQFLENISNNSKLIKFAARNFPYPPLLSVNEQVVYWEALIVSLIIRFTALYPEYSMEMNLDLVPRKITGKCDLKLFAKFGFNEAFDICLQDSPQQPSKLILSDQGIANSILNRTFDVIAIDNVVTENYDEILYEVAYKEADEINFRNPMGEEESKEDKIEFGEEKEDEKEDDYNYYREQEESVLATNTSQQGNDDNSVADPKSISHAIYYAANQGRITLIRSMMKFSLFTTGTDCDDAILTAVQRERFDIARLLLEKCEEIKPKQAAQILKELVQRGNFDLFRYIFERQIFFDPIHVQALLNIAASKGHLAFLKFFYDERTERVAKLTWIESVLESYEAAAAAGRLDVIEYLNDLLTNDYEIISNAKALIKSAEYGQSSALKHFLKQYKFQEESTLKDAIIAAAQNDHTEIIQIITQKQPGYRGGYSEALLAAVLQGNLKTVTYLLRTFPLIPETDVIDAFEVAVRSQNPKIVEQFIRTRREDFNENCITRALNAGNSEMKALLLKYYKLA